MKNINKFIAFAQVLALLSCKESFIGQYPVDSIPPGTVSNIQVTAQKGGATISYDLPDDIDVLYVKANYSLPNGDPYEQRASSYENSMEIRGFGKSRKYNVELRAVDRSGNESAPLSIELEPFDSPIYEVLESLESFSSWGGIKVRWNNPEKENIVVGVVVKDEQGNYETLDNFYGAQAIGDMAVRGMDTTEVEIGVFVRDRFQNHTDTLFSVHKPLFEMKLDPSKFKGFPQSADYPLGSWPSYKNMDILWDGQIQPDANVYYIAPTGLPNPYLTMDLGETVKLSRTRFWSRQAWIFQLHSPKHFEIWGTADPSKVVNDRWDGWVKLLDAEAYRPSGLPPGELPTTDDKTYAEAGEEYEFDIDIPSVRYIRFRSTETWSGSNGLNLAEIAFWGAKIN